jgi:hypothetical protein
MAKRKIGDMVTDGVLDAEIAVLRTDRQAVQAVNRNLRAAKRKVTGRKAKRKVTGSKKAAKKTARRAVSRTKRAVRRSPGNARCDGSPGRPQRRQPEERRDVAGAARLPPHQQAIRAVIAGNYAALVIDPPPRPYSTGSEPNFR